ncbi:hypothetical protein [Peterkaempfera griseoplana]|uniref:hypothetical protein n=1 Tax=Peterkaempfera griseoplana TaxID=66896 RepID=UPI0006E1717B|nr:hypothetical protein [Peterkaempfera griseoplana]
MKLSLDAFTLTADYGRAHTTFDLHTDGQDAPAARMHKEGAYSSRHPFQVYGGPGLDRLLGQVTPHSARSADGTPIGRVDHRERLLRHPEWTFVQDGLGRLTGEPAGVGSTLRRGTPLHVLLDRPALDTVLATRLRFRAGQSAGFDLTRRAGAAARYALRIHDPRIDRLLVLACVLHFDTYGSTDPRKRAVDRATGP